MNNDNRERPLPPTSRLKTPAVIATGVAAVLSLGALMMWRADRRTNKVALSTRPKPVTVIRAKSAVFRPSRNYVGALEPWVAANIGPQLVSAYVDTVLVRPGAVVKQREVLATLDCRDSSASTKAIAASARAIDAHQQAIAHEAARTAGMVSGGFVSTNEMELKDSQSAAELARLESERASLARSSLQVSDCVLRAPFDGEVAQRYVDPGAFVRPGNPIVTVVDRRIVRMTADAPEVDFDVVAPRTKVIVHVFATNHDFVGSITRRAPTADDETRTVHFEVDIPDPTRSIPVGTTGAIQIDVGAPTAATEMPLFAATIRGHQASVFIVDEKHLAHQRVLGIEGEVGGSLFVEASLPSGTPIVAEGRALLEEGDRVEPSEDTEAADESSSELPAPQPSPAAPTAAARKI
jgi:RND family efflux transporter MFP subunit